MLKVMRDAARMAALYIQLFTHAYNSGFQSDRYTYIQTEADEYPEDSEEEEYGRAARTLLQRCTSDYLVNLHMAGDFAIHECEI